ncbi:molybdopterin-dependent oxidoreductase [Halobacteria archaeon AArc-m2/3/4]|uniref:Molybdopterin-dependent oxidoreductase n=1 Tax=Natronoglomus mannanivorans TaxID=2979990 RepID=A0ABT2QH57_9EURY|nr:molybdopterin-dependent oxidoreductase [Halobacteria archaeon AArc-m2/3/4]
MSSSTTHRTTIGAVVGAAWVGGLFAAGPLVGGFAPDAVAEWIIVRSPGWLSTLAISQLGFYAKPVLVTGVVAGVVAVSAAVALAWPRFSRGKRLVAVGLGIVATAALFSALGTGVSLGAVGGLLVAVAPPYVVAHLLTAPRVPSNRRRFLERVGTVAVGSAVSLAGLRLVLEWTAGPQESPRVEEPLERRVSPPDGDPAFDFEGMPPAITPPGSHYVVDITVSKPTIDPEEWALEVDGVVEEPYELSYDELLAHEGSLEQPTTMICISNQVGGDLIGTGHWTGVPLSELVAAAGPTESAVDVVTHAADGYSEAIPIELVEREDILVAYGMGDRTLATEHGFPARLLVPGRYGMKMTKWLTRIEVADRTHEAYWEARGWDEEAVVETMAYVRGAERDGDRVEVGGVAFAGLETGVEEISGVEVSVDGGEQWQAAEVEPQLAPHAWRRWRYAFEAPDETEFDVVVRALESDGTVQTEEESSPRPSGATGWHRMSVSV